MTCHEAKVAANYQKLLPLHCYWVSHVVRRRLTLEEELLVKFIDGNVKAQDAEGRFLHSEYSEGIPDGLTQPGYTELWKQAVARDPHATVLEEK